MPRLHRKALKKSFWSSLAKLIGVAFGAAAGTLLHKLLGDELREVGTMLGLFVVSFVLIWFAEYEREAE